MAAYQFTSDSLVTVSVASKPILGMKHEPVIGAAPPRTRIELVETDGRVSADVSFELDPRELAPGSHGRADSEKIRANLVGKDVLDADRFPTIIVKGRYEGTRTEGKLDARITLRGVPQHVTFPVTIRHEGERLRVQGEWEGTLTSLGIKPFRALLGALTLKDWVRLTFRVELEPLEPE